MGIPKHQIDFSVSSNETPSSWNRLHLIELLNKGSHGNPQTSQAVAKNVALQKWTARPYCRSQYLYNTVSVEQPHWCLLRAFIPTD